MTEAPIPGAPGVSTDTLERIKLYATRNERNLSIAFFAAGFLFDILTLGRIDSWLTIGQQAAYLIAVTLVLIQMLLAEGQPEKSAADLAALPRMKRWYYEYRSPAIHFLLGALLSAYTLFFFTSSSNTSERCASESPRSSTLKLTSRPTAAAWRRISRLAIE